MQTLYREKDYQGALKTLEQHRRDLSPGVWHYNMGTVLAKLENPALSRYHFVMAEKAGLTGWELQENRSLVETKLDVARLERPLSTSDYLRKAGMLASDGVFMTIALLLIIGGITSAWKRTSGSLTAAFFILSFSLLSVNFWIMSWDQVIVMKPQVLSEGPSAIFGQKEEIPAGVILVVEKRGEWLKVLYPSRFEGWILSQGLKELK